MGDIRDFCPLWGIWEADKKLGEGSFGTVWKVRRDVLGGKTYYAAVKHISIPKDESEVRQMLEEGVFTSEESATRYYNNMLQSLLDEIEIMHTLQGYTNIVSYEDHLIIPKQGGIGYDLFLRMELLTPLAERIRQGMSAEEVVRFGKDMATAIDVLNTHHLVHRDIKPQNIFVNSTGDYKLGDYGTARALENNATAMSRKGTYNYMSPEIYSNRPADIRVDIYSLGIVMYRLLNGNRLPFLPLSGDLTHELNETALVRRLSGEPFPPPAYAPPALAEIVLKACAFNPADRYQSAKELKEDLERYKVNGDPAAVGFAAPKAATQHVPVQFAPAPVRFESDAEQAASHVQTPEKNRIGIWIAAVAVILVLGFAGYKLLGSGQDNDRPAAGIGTVLPMDTTLYTSFITATPTSALTPTPIPTSVPDPTATPAEVAMHRCVDATDGTSFMIPDGWNEETTQKDGNLAYRASTKHVAKGSDVVFVHTSTDDWTYGQTIAGSKSEFDTLMNRRDAISALFGGAQIEETVFNGIAFFRYQSQSSTWQYLRYHHGILHLFQINVDTDDMYYPYFAAIMNSVVFP